MEILMDLATVRAIRKKSQYDLWLSTGIHQSRISLLERGYVVPKDSEKVTIANALGVAVNEIRWPEAASHQYQGTVC